MLKPDDDSQVRDIFQAATRIQLGDGEKASLWHSKWPLVGTIGEFAPTVYTYVSKSRITVAEGLHNSRWVRDIGGSLSPSALHEYFALRQVLAQVKLQLGQPDEIVWSSTANGQYSASAAYGLFFLAKTKFGCGTTVWKARAPARCKFFMWLALRGRAQLRTTC